MADLNANESSPGWFRIQAWGTNVAGFRLEDCSCQLSVGGNAQIQPNGQGPIFLGDADNGQTLYYEFDVYSQPGGGDFTYTVLFSGYTYN